MTFNMNEYAYIDHGYAVTNYQGQGQEAPAVIYHADTRKLVNFHSFYVAASRAKENVLIYTYNKEEFLKQTQQEQQKTSTLAYSLGGPKQHQGLALELSRSMEQSD